MRSSGVTAMACRPTLERPPERAARRMHRRRVDGALDARRLPFGAAAERDHRYAQDHVQEQNDDDDERRAQQDDAVDLEPRRAGLRAGAGGERDFGGAGNRHRVVSSTRLVWASAARRTVSSTPRARSIGAWYDGVALVLPENRRPPPGSGCAGARWARRPCRDRKADRTASARPSRATPRSPAPAGSR